MALMVAVSASDEDIRTAELVKIQSAVQMLPIFAGYDDDRLQVVSQAVFDLFEQEDGLDALFVLILEGLPERLFESGYALACDVAAADGTLDEAELRLLEEIRHELNLDRLDAAAIERRARARYLTSSGARRPPHRGISHLKSTMASSRTQRRQHQKTPAKQSLWLKNVSVKVEFSQKGERIE